MRGRAREAVKFPHDLSVKFLRRGIGHQPIELWTARLRAANSFVYIDFREFPALHLTMLTNIAQLDLRVLMMVIRANSCVCNNFHVLTSHDHPITVQMNCQHLILSITCEGFVNTSGRITAGGLRIMAPSRMRERERCPIAPTLQQKAGCQPRFRAPNA